MKIVFNLLVTLISLFVVLNRGVNTSKNVHVRKGISNRNVKDMPEMLKSLNMTREKWKERYTYQQLQDNFLEKIAAFFPKSVRLLEIGTSTKGQPVYALEIQPKAHTGATVLIDAAQDGDEWGSVNMAMYIIYRLLTQDVQLAYWLRIAVIPIVNPDGYRRSTNEHEADFNTNDREIVLPNGTRLCDGVAISRNFDVGPPPKFEGCPTFQGLKYGSEKESQNVMSYFRKLGDVKLYLSLHTGPFPVISYPYAYQNATEHKSSKKMALIMKKVINDRLTNAGIADMELVRADNLATMFTRSFGGAAVDWAADVMNVPYSIYITIQHGMESNKEIDTPFDALITETVYESFYQATKRVVYEEQVTDAGVGKAFLQECGAKTSTRSAGNLPKFNLKISLLFFLMSFYIPSI